MYEKLSFFFLFFNGLQEHRTDYTLLYVDMLFFVFSFFFFTSVLFYILTMTDTNIFVATTTYMHATTVAAGHR